MQNVTLAVNPVNSSMKVAGVPFHFSRSVTGEGLWYSSKKIGTTPPNVAAPISLQNAFSEMAREQGLSEEHSFSRFPTKEVKAESVKREKKERKGRQGSMFGAFNPFAVAGE